MYIFLYLGFNLLNISKTAALDSYVCVALSFTVVQNRQVLHN